MSIILRELFCAPAMSEAVEQIEFVAYNVAFIIIAIGILGNVLSLVVLTRPNMKVRIIFPPRILFPL